MSPQESSAPAEVAPPAALFNVMLSDHTDPRRLLALRRGALGLTQAEAVAAGVATSVYALSHAEAGHWRVSPRRLAAMLAAYDLVAANQRPGAPRQPARPPATHTPAAGGR